jgi:hemerythrin-like metal-binding protein
MRLWPCICRSYIRTSNPIERQKSVALITWTSTLSVGIKEIDSQHQHLIKLINDLHEAMKDEKGRDGLGRTLKSLCDYTVFHFGTEEKLFKETGYPGTEAHLAEHKSFTRQVLDIRSRFEAGQSVITIDLLQFLRDWVNDHIKGVDKKYTSFLHSKGIQ